MRLPVGVVGLGQVDGDDPVGVAGDDRLVRGSTAGRRPARLGVVVAPHDRQTQARRAGRSSRRLAASATVSARGRRDRRSPGRCGSGRQLRQRRHGRRGLDHPVAGVPSSALAQRRTPGRPSDAGSSPPGMSSECRKAVTPTLGDRAERRAAGQAGGVLEEDELTAAVTGEGEHGGPYPIAASHSPRQTQSTRTTSTVTSARALALGEDHALERRDVA